MSLKRFIVATVGSLAALAISSQALHAQDPTLFSPSEPASIFSGGAQYLVMSRDTKLSSNTKIVNGPDSQNIGFDSTDFHYESGVRGFLAVETDGIRLEAVYSNYGDWHEMHQGSFTQGLAFDDGITGPWLGANSLTASTYFSPLAAASTPILGGEVNEFEGLGPNGGFPGDDFPAYRTWYNSRLRTVEVNLMTASPDSLFQYGIGYNNFQLTEGAGTEITGTFRAANGVGPNNGLSDASLTGVGGLTFLGGTPDGFQDEVGNISGFPDTLTMFREATTRNSLNGVQAIFQQEIMYYRGIVVNGVFKAGLYHNSANGSIIERYTGTDPSLGGPTSSYGRVISDSRDVVAFAGTVGLQSSIPISEHWSLIGGYEATIVHGVALAPDQNLAADGQTYDINANGDLIIHGANAGLQFKY